MRLNRKITTAFQRSFVLGRPAEQFNFPVSDEHTGFVY
jgi:hypothetical protein